MNIEEYIVPYDCVDFMREKNILVIAPHCDDEIFGCGGAVAKALMDGSHVRVVVVSKSFNFKERENESLCAANTLGYKEIEFWDFIDGEVFSQKEELSLAILKYLQEFKPDLIFIPSIWEMHRDHLACCSASIEALKSYPSNIEVAMYEVGVPLSPTNLVDVSDVYEIKQKAMKCFLSQQKTQNYIEQIEGLNSFRTYTVDKSIKYVEAFWVGDKESAIELYSQKSVDKFYAALKKEMQHLMILLLL